MLARHTSTIDNPNVPFSTTEGHEMTISVVLRMNLLFALIFGSASAFVLAPLPPRTRTSLRVVDRIQQVLHEHGLDGRIVTLSSESLPVVAELYNHGTTQLGRIQRLILSNDDDVPPKVEVLVGDSEVLQTVDVGQITTVWNENHSVDDEQLNTKGSIPIPRMDGAMEELYNNVAHRHGQGGLTKKQIAAIGDAQIQDVLRKVNKAGGNMRLLVDSVMAINHLGGDGTSPRQRAASAVALAVDAQLGGRFKRMACIPLTTSSSEITMVNGGWLAVDRSVCASTEARKWVQREGKVLTRADERIVHRLECLAMGVISADQGDVEVHVKESLKLLELPVTPQGAREALVRLEWWSEGAKVDAHEPWSPDTLEAAKAYATMDLERRKMLLGELQGEKGDLLEDRIDLTKLPCICVDAKSTVFRDDAIGIRPRAATGRKVVPEASRWELLIHIADVSDVYFKNAFGDESTRQALEAAAVSRGQSRYDLPLGPLHLMPPTALKAFGFVTNRPNDESRSALPSRCVTVWAYIDERDGKVLDVGMERTLISPPLALTYDQATQLVESGTPDKTDPLYQAYAVLSVANRNVNLWSQRRKQTSSAARKREERLKVKELVASQTGGDRNRGFQRTLGHQLVDSCLNLYGNAMTNLLRSAKAPVPRASGSGGSRGGRVATAPLRRYVDGMAQRQALAVLCSYGGLPLTKKDCEEVNSNANRAMDRLANLQPLKHRMSNSNAPRQRRALSILEAQMDETISAISTGRGNEVTIVGVGAIGICRGVEGRLTPGETLVVRIKQLDVDRGTLKVELVP